MNRLHIDKSFRDISRNLILLFRDFTIKLVISFVFSVFEACLIEVVRDLALPGIPVQSSNDRSSLF